MELEAFKERVAEGVNLPKELLTGETSEEVISQAKALLTYKKENSPMYENKGEFFALEMIQQEAEKDSFIERLAEGTPEEKPKNERTPGEVFAEWASNFL